MRFGQVVGTLNMSIQDESLKGGRFLLVSPLTKEQILELNGQSGSAIGPLRPLSGIFTTVVYDDLGAGQEDIVGFVEGAEATMPFDYDIPLDAYNVCILEHTFYQPPVVA